MPRLHARPEARSGPTIFAILLSLIVPALAAVPVTVKPVTAPHGMVVAGHPEAAEIGAQVLRDGGNAIDAAVAVSLALGVAEPYGSGLGGKLMLLYHDAKTGRTHAVEAMDEAGSLLVPEEYRRRDERARYDGWSSVCVPGLAAGLHEAHAKWGRRAWAANVDPVVKLARDGFTVLPKTRELFEERIEKLRADGDLARLFLRDGTPPPAGAKLANEELAKTMELLARDGAGAFYRGPIARAIVEASQRGGGLLTPGDFANYRARIVEPLEVKFRGATLVSSPAPTNGAPLFLAILKVLEDSPLRPPLHTADNLDRIGRVWREIYPTVQRTTGDYPGAAAAFEQLVTPENVRRISERVFAAEPALKAAWLHEPESVHASTTHFVVADRDGNIVCATQSQSLHFGAGVAVAGIVMNDSMSNFSISDPKSPNALAPGRRPRSTISPTIVLHDGKPTLALGIPGASRIPTAVLQILIDHLMFGRSLEEAIGDTRVHWYDPFEAGKPDLIEAERSLPEGVAKDLRARGWEVNLPENPGTGRHFGGINAITLNRDGTFTGFADPRRTNAAVGVQ